MTSVMLLPPRVMVVPSTRITASAPRATSRCRPAVSTLTRPRSAASGSVPPRLTPSERESRDSPPWSSVTRMAPSGPMEAVTGRVEP